MKKMLIKDLNKSFGRHQVLDQINLEFDQPGIYGLLGPNGAGKSTLLEVVNDGLLVKSGQVLIDGQDVHDSDSLLQKIWLMNSTMPFNRWLTVEGAMKMIDAVRGNFDFASAFALLKQFKINSHSRISQLSTGQQTSVKLVLALNVSADVILLDEPVLGLDANHRELFYSALLKAYNQRPRIFIIATHLIDEVAQLIDHVVILNHHRIQIVGETEQILARSFEISGDSQRVKQYIKGMNVLTEKPAIGGNQTAVVFDTLPSQKQAPQGVAVRHLDLQSLFIALTNAVVPERKVENHE